MTAKTIFFISLQILFTAPGCLSMRTQWQDEPERDDSGVTSLVEDSGEPVSPVLVCSLIRCPGLTDANLRDCQRRRCAFYSDSPSGKEDVSRDASQDQERSSYKGQTCAQRRCAGRRGLSLRRCAAARCALREERRDSARRLSDLSDSAVRRLAEWVTKRGGGLKGLWPDEFETRMAERAMWPDEYETRNVERRENSPEEERKAEVEAEEESARGEGSAPELVRRARSDPEMDGQEPKSELKSVQKRWSTRLCMESHCKNAHSKVQYFMCGKAYCHR